MISYIVASNDPGILYLNLLDTLRCYPGDEILLEEDPPSIAVAYNRGTARAANQIKCYVHHDVRILDLDLFRGELIEHCTPDVGVVGVIGSLTEAIPWWDGQGCGNVNDARVSSPIDFSPGGQLCAYLDGLVLATAQDVTWDEMIEGFHFYDLDICKQMLSRGLQNYCLRNGKDMITHNTRGPGSVNRITTWQAAESRFREKWG